jgi:ornithine carbamoyltransferase
MRERFGTLAGRRVVYVGDGRNNMANSLMLGCAKAGMHFVNCTPDSLMPEPDLVSEATAVAESHGGSVTIDPNPETAVRGANVIYSDVWVSMGEEAQQAERIRLLGPYQVDERMMAQTGNIDRGDVIFLHCLPAFHDHNTEVSRETGALEVTDAVFEADYSLVFDQAENRMHTIKAIFVATLGRQDDCI